MDYMTRTEIMVELSSLSKRISELGEILNIYTDDRIDNITPYTETKTAYYGESEKVFYGVPQGNITVFWANYAGDYAVERIADRIVVSFDALTDNATISIMIQ